MSWAQRSFGDVEGRATYAVKPTPGFEPGTHHYEIGFGTWIWLPRAKVRRDECG